MPLSEFGPLLKRHLGAAGLSVSEFARRARCSRNLADCVIRGIRRPPLDRLDAWADILGLRGEARQEFLFVGHLGHTPRMVVERLRKLEEQVERLTKRR